MADDSFYNEDIEVEGNSMWEDNHNLLQNSNKKLLFLSIFILVFISGILFFLLSTQEPGSGVSTLPTTETTGESASEEKSDEESSDEDMEDSEEADEPAEEESREDSEEESSDEESSDEESSEEESGEEESSEEVVEGEIIDCGVITRYVEDNPFDEGETTNAESVYSCVANAAENCELVEYDMHGVAVFYGVQITSMDHFEIRGIESGKCEYYLVHEDYSLIFTEEAINNYLEAGQTQEQIVQIQQDMQNDLSSSIGIEGICLFDTLDLVDMFNRWANGQITTGFHCEGGLSNITCVPTGDLEVAECSGDYWGGSI